MAYAERFGVEPHLVNPPARWWKRLGALDQARASRRAREFIEQHGVERASADTRALYNALMLELTGHRDA